MCPPRIEVEREDDGRWIAEILDVPGALAYGHSPEEAIQRVEELCRQILATSSECGELN
jgi:predicted RNase H-like HicB family nuclease